MTLDWLKAAFPDLRDLTSLSDGGQKIVFSAEHDVDGLVVLKLLRPPVQIEQLRREIQTTAAIQSRRVPPILASGSISTPFGDCYWIREMRIDGATVRDAIRDRPLDPTETLRLADHVLEALCAAENKQIVHRDVKPENIMRDTKGRYWLIDFGIARHLSLPSLTPNAALFGRGTLGYAPLEQVSNRKPEIDTRADLYALGVTLYEVTTRVQPFRKDATTDEEVLDRQERTQQLDLPPPDSAGIAELIAALTQRQASFRPTTAAAVLKWVRDISARRR